MKGRVQAIVRAVQILNLLEEKGSEQSLASIAQGVGLPKTTTYGIVATLRDLKFIDQSVYTGKYKLGTRLFELGSAVARGWDLRVIAIPYLQRLMAEVGETVHLAILDQNEVLYIDKRESRQSLRIVSEVGIRLPAHCSAIGKTLLAYLPELEVRRIITQRGLKRFTKSTICEPEQLIAELRNVRTKGYAIDNGEIMDGLRCVAAPIWNHDKVVVAAISIAGPSSRMSGERLIRLAEDVMRTASEISKEMGFSPPND